MCVVYKVVIEDADNLYITFPVIACLRSEGRGAQGDLGLSRNRYVAGEVRSGRPTVPEKWLHKKGEHNRQ